MKKAFFFFLSFLMIITSACTQNTGQVTIEKQTNAESAGSTFTVLKENAVCAEQGKPIIREFSTSWCPHCAWIKETYQSVINEYKGQIIAHQWEIDTGNDLLTEPIEFDVPADELNVFKKFNPKETIPTFVFGCKYIRIGNAFEQQGDKNAEAAEFRATINKLIDEVKTQ